MILPAVIDNNRERATMGIVALDGTSLCVPVVSCRSHPPTLAGMEWTGHRRVDSSRLSSAPLAPIPICMFEQLRDALRGFSDRSSPDDRRRSAYAMKEALVHAKLGVQDLKEAVEVTARRVEEERSELATVERRLGLAIQINDQETVTIAERFRAQHAERLAVLETKLMSQQQELNLMERELEDMTVQMRRAISGLPINGNANVERDAMREVDAALSDDPGATNMSSDEPEIPRLSRAEKEAAAEDRLAALKRRMGK
ncbi:MAG: hypothetical protein ABI852_00420 [Gemmatimonadaceae bacterium]